MHYFVKLESGKAIREKLLLNPNPRKTRTKSYNHTVPYVIPVTIAQILNCCIIQGGSLIPLERQDSAAIGGF